MRYSFVIGALCAAAAVAKPVDKRELVVDLTWVTVTEYVTPGQGLPTAAPTAPLQHAANADGYGYSVASSYTIDSSYTIETYPAAEPTTSSTPVVVQPSSSEVPSAVAPTTAAPTTTAPVYTAPASTSTSAPAATTSAASTGTDYQSVLLDSHNIHRANHSASDLTWDADLVASAEVLANKCVFEHNTDINGGGYGQNIGYGYPSTEIGQMITNGMYNDEMGFFAGLYGQDSPSMTDFSKWGHFTQIVWKGSEKVGCFTATCGSFLDPDSGTTSSNVPFTVCNYSPTGNMIGDFGSNVGEPLGNAMVTA